MNTEDAKRYAGLHWRLCPTPLYSPLDIEYQKEYCGGVFEDKSLVGDEWALVASLKDGLIDGYGRPMMLYGKKFIERKLKSHLEGFLQYRIRYCDYLLGGLSPVTRYLLKAGATARPVFTQVMPIPQDLGEVWDIGRMRKSYRNLIRRGKPEFAMIDTLHSLHSTMHGRETRSSRTWDIQKSMISHSAADCFEIDGAAVMMYRNQISAYYACSASVAGVNTHSLIWAMAKNCRRNGQKAFEFGEQVFSGDKKLVNISSFKRGFGGKTITRLMVEYDPEDTDTQR